MVRIEETGIAKQLLARKDMTVSQVAESVGYKDPFHFSKSFKQTFGISPTDFKDKA